MNIADKISSFIRDISWNELPDGVKKRAKMCLIDNLGVTLAGTLTRISHISAGFAV